MTLPRRDTVAFQLSPASMFLEKVCQTTTVHIMLGRHAKKTG